MVVYEIDEVFLPQMHVNERFQDKYGEIIIDGGVYAEYAENAVAGGVMLSCVRFHWDRRDINGKLITLNEDDALSEIHAIVYPVWDSIGSDMFIPNDKRMR